MGHCHHLENVLFRFLLVSLAVSQVCPMTVSCPATLQATRGDVLTLSCSFSSSSPASSRTSVEWTYRPQGGGTLHSVFHYFSQAYPPTEGHFMGRVKWIGNLAWGDASLQVLNASLSDNGTYACAVRNPPGDVHGSPCQTELTVIPKGMSLRFSDVAVLMAFVLIPSAITALVLLCHMCCCRREKAPPRGGHSPIEITEREELVYGEYKEKNCCFLCCEMYLQDFDSDEYLTHSEKYPKEAIAESQC